jgi:hypothetical protein
MCALLVGLPDVRVVGVGEWPQWLRIVITNHVERPWCYEPDQGDEAVGTASMIVSPVGVLV